MGRGCAVRAHAAGVPSGAEPSRARDRAQPSPRRGPESVRGRAVPLRLRAWRRGVAWCSGFSAALCSARLGAPRRVDGIAMS